MSERHSSIKPTARQLRYLRVLATRTGTTFTTPRSIAEARRQIKEMEQRKRTPRSDVQRERREVSMDMATRRGDATRVRRDELSGYGSSATWGSPSPEEAGPRVVNCHREAYDVLIDRTTKWGNPFVVGRDGTREECIEKFERWAPTQPHLMAALLELRGKTLGCHCKPKTCHGDPLCRWANAPLTAEPTAQVQVKGEPHVFAGYRTGSERRLIVVQRIRGAIRVGDLSANGKGKRYLVADGLKTCGELDDLLNDYNGQIAKFSVVPASPSAVTRDVVDHLYELMA